MRIPKRLGEATKVVKENSPDIEELIQKKLQEFRNLDIQGIIRKQSEFDEIVKTLNEKEKEQFEKEFDELADQHGGLLGAVADALEDPEVREKIIDELQRRVRA